MARDDTGDVALLRLDRPVPGTCPAPLVDGTAYLIPSAQLVDE
ncbi:hypothetical protein ABZ924_19380 [Streptomyces sp. NPDC046876]